MIAGKLALRELKQRPGRTLLTLASVVLGVASLVAVWFTEGATRHAFDGVFRTIAGKTDLEAVAEAGGVLRESVYARTSKTPGVQAASPRLQRPTIMYHGKRRFRLVALGIVPALDAPLQEYSLVAGNWFKKGDEAVLNEQFAKSAGVELGDAVTLLTRSGQVTARIVGFTSSETAAAGNLTSVLLLPLRTAQFWFRAPRGIDTIAFLLAPDVDRETAAATIRNKLPDGALVRAPVTRSAAAEETSLSVEQALEMGTASALLVTVFVIANTFLISVTQRRQELGMLRAIGATRGQVLRQILLQAVLIGIVGAVTGGLIGAGGAVVLTREMGSLYDTVMPPVQFSIWPFISSGALGIVLAIAGAAWPARKAASLSPQEAMREVLPHEIEGFSRGMAWAGVAIILACGAVLTASVLGLVAAQHAVWSAVLLLTGVVFLSPRAIRPLTATIASAAPRWLRTEAKLASRQLLVHRSRTALTAGVVFIALAAGVGLANAVIDNEANVRAWYRKAIVADFFVRADFPDMSTGLAADLPDDLGEKLRSVSGITKINTLRFVGATAAGLPVVIVTSQFDDPELYQFDVVRTAPGNLQSRLNKGEVVIGSVLAQRAGLAPGDELPVELDSNEKPVCIAAIANDYYAGGLTVYMQQAAAKRLWEIGGVDVYTLNVDPQRRTEVEQALTATCRENGLLLQRTSDVQARVDHMIAGIDAGLWGLVVLGLIVAAFGVANTLTMSVLQQTREFGVLRSVAATRGQIRKLVFSEAMLIAALAIVPGVAAGQGVAYLIYLATQPVTGRVVHFGIHPELLVGAAIGGLVVILCAAWGPAERAVRIDLPEALRVG